MSAENHTTKISGTVAESEAIVLLEKISHCPENAAALGRELNRQFTAAPRKMILGKLREQLSREQFVHQPPEVLAQAVHNFLETQLAGVNERHFEDHFREILALTAELPEAQGVPVAADLMHKLTVRANFRAKMRIELSSWDAPKDHSNPRTRRRHPRYHRASQENARG